MSNTYNEKGLIPVLMPGASDKDSSVTKAAVGAGTLFNRYLGLAKEAGNVFGFGFNLGPKLALVDGLPSGNISHFASDVANKSNSLYAVSKNTGGISSSTSATKMFGANGLKVMSEIVWRNKNSKYERIDVENPNPGERAGQIHYHDKDNVKYIYDFDKG